MIHDEKTLPKWAQQILEHLRSVIHHREAELKRLRDAHAVLTNRNWFVVGGPPTEQLANMPSTYHLWFLCGDAPHRACSLQSGDVLLVCRAIEPKSPKPSICTPTTQMAQFIEDLNFLRRAEGSSVTIINDNPDFGSPNSMIYVTADFTNWTQKRYTGESLTECVIKATKDAKEYYGKRDRE